MSTARALIAGFAETFSRRFSGTPTPPGNFMSTINRSRLTSWRRPRMRASRARWTRLEMMAVLSHSGDDAAHSCDMARRAAQGAVVFQPPTVLTRRSRQILWPWSGTNRATHRAQGSGPARASICKSRPPSLAAPPRRLVRWLENHRSLGYSPLHVATRNHVFPALMITPAATAPPRSSSTESRRSSASSH